MDTIKSMDKPKGITRLYGCGGTGINIGNMFSDVRGVDTIPGCARLEISYIDSSSSNLSKVKAPTECIYLLEGKDGAGKIRAELAGDIDRNIKQILLQHKPGDFNIFVFSAGGGSGNVFGSLMMRHLISEGHSCVGVVVGSTDSTKELENTINTLKSLDSIAKQIERPITIAYFQNERDKPIKDTDERVRHVIAGLTMLSSRRNDGLDTKDIHTWLNFQKTTNITPRLSSLTVTADPSIAANSDIVSAASIYSEGSASPLPFEPEYRCDGVFMETISEKINQMHYLIDVRSISQVVNALTVKLKERTQVRDSRVLDDGLASSKDNVTGNGLVL